MGLGKTRASRPGEVSYNLCMRSAFLIFVLGCSSSPTTPIGSDASDAQVDVAQMDDAQDAMMGFACDPNSKMGDPSGGTFKTSRGTNVIVRTPPGYDPSVGSPLVVVYAPCCVSGSATEGFVGLTPKAKNRGYLIAYPDHITPQSSTDFADAAAVLTGITDAWCVDPKRIYLTGHSDGGSIAEILTIKNMAKPAAIAPSAAGINAMYLMGQVCPKEMVPEMEIHSKNDQLFPISQGFGGQTAAWWAKCDMCDAMPGAPDANNCVVYPSCAMGTEVRYCEGSGVHGQWPGALIAGINDAIFDFFDRFQKP